MATTRQLKRPRVSVICPFFGDRADARLLLDDLSSLQRQEGDEVIVVDNTPGETMDGMEAGSIEVLSAPVKHSAYAARNFGAEQASNDWLLFTDADCRPAPSLLDDFFAESVADQCGAVAGEISAATGQQTLAARYARSRGYLSLEVHRQHPHLPIAATANVLVRVAALKAIGGFPEGMTPAGGDVYFSWRMQEVGWELCFRPAAVVEHRHRDSLRELARQNARNAAGAAWINRRYPGSMPRPRPVRGIVRSAAGAAFFALTGRLERARFKLVDGVVVLAEAVGYLRSNSAPDLDSPTVQSVVVCGSFPEIGALPGLGRQGDGLVRVEAAQRASDADWPAVRGLAARFWEDDGIAARALALAWLLIRHPFRVLADLRAGPRRQVAGPLRQLGPAVRRISARGRVEIQPGTGGSGDETLARRIASLSGSTYKTGVR